MDDSIEDRTSVGFTANTFPLQQLNGADDDPFLKPFTKVAALWQRSHSYLPNTLFPDYASYFRRIAGGGTFGECIGLVPFEGREFLPLRVLDPPVIETPMNDESGEAVRPTLLYSFFRSPR